MGSAVACGAPGPDGAEPLGQSQQRFVNGGDDRLDYFELSEPSERAPFDEYAVVLMSAGAASAVANGHADALGTWRDTNLLCEGEPFAEQPSAAFCSGVLLDWNLVLTSGHCINVLPLEELRVAFGFFYRAEGELAMGEGDVHRVARVVTSRRDEATPGDQGERLDFAWLELAEPAEPPRRPAPTFTTSLGTAAGNPVISISAGGGAPLKWDAGGQVRNTRPDFDDYFIADTDTSQGSSGGGIYDENLVLLGSLARGAADFTRTDAGCYTTATESDPARAREQFTYVHRAVEALCATGSASLLCDPACGEPCDTSQLPSPAPPRGSDDSGCALRAPGERASTPLGLSLGLLLGLGLARNARRARR